ncbi:MAG: DUF2069 domain-containing protein [Pseudomonadota bacterium]
MRGFLFLILLAIGTLFGIAGMRHLLLALPLDATDWLAFGLHAGPALLLLPALLRAGPSTSKTQFVIVALLGMFYFVLGVVFASGSAGRLLGFIEVAVALLLVATASMAASRLPTPPKNSPNTNRTG